MTSRDLTTTGLAPTKGDAASGADRSIPELQPGDRIANYVVRELLGEGGFAVVFVAEQQEPVRRRVALKIIKLGMDTRQSPMSGHG